MTPKQSPSYDAFISYAQGPDSRIAGAIQDGLSRMAWRWEDLSSLTVFRDATSLHVGPLEASLRNALENARYLIVITSPRSAASNWVLDEIRMFLDHHAPENILIVLTEGELTWSASDGRFVLDGTTPFPNLGGNVMGAEPVYVDLRWAREPQDLSIGNERFLDALASLAGTISGVPKDRIIGTVITERFKLRRNQQINLGFRGLIGFGVTPLLMIIWTAVFGFSSASVLAPKMYGFALFLAGFPLTGIAGALVLGTRWRGAAGFGLGFLAALPLYVIGSLHPFLSRATDMVALAVLTAASFSLAGAAGGYLTKEGFVRRSAAAFGAGGIVAAALFVLFPEWRPEGVHTFIAEGPWLADRLIIAGSRAIEVCAEVFDDRSVALLFPLLFGAGVGGMLFGISVARRRIQIPRRARRFSISAGRMGRNTRRALKIVGAAGVIAATIAFVVTLTDGYQTRRALAELKAVNLSSTFPIGTEESCGDDSWMDAFVIALRARKALQRSGNSADAAEFSNLVSTWIEQFGRAPARFAANRYCGPSVGANPIESVSQALRDYGRPGELERLMTMAHESARGSGVEAMSAVARAELSSGLKAKALELLTGAESKLRGKSGIDSWYNRALVAEGFYEAGDVERSRRMLTDLATDIQGSGKQDEAVLIGLDDDLPASSGNAIWGTGVWNEFGPLRNQLGGATTSAVAAMCRSGKLSEAVAAVKGAGSGHIQPSLARTAAQAGQFDTAFGILDGIRNTTSPGWTDYDDEAEALVEIITEAKRANRPDIKAAALGRLKRLQESVRKPNKAGAKLDRFTGLEICRALAAAGDFQNAWAAVDELTENKWDGYALIGTALAESGDSRQARRALRLAWKQFHLDHRLTTDESYSFLSEIGQALARAGDLRAARYAAEDIGRDFAHYTGDQEQISQLLVFVSILESAAH